MRFCVIQPAYSLSEKDLDVCFADMLRLMDRCDDSMDVIVLPEYCDIPAATESAAGFKASIERFNERFREKAVETARRCRATVFSNFGMKTDLGWRNTTFAFDKEGRQVAAYCKAHPAPSEEKTPRQGGNGMDCSYSYEYRKPYVVEIDGVRYGFMTCYDFYMYEAFPALAREHVDVIIGCSHQRTDTHDALELIGRFLCYNTNAYLVRSAVSMGADSPVCGCSMIVGPDGKMLANMKNEVGLCVVDLDPKRKYLKPGGFRGAPVSHAAYVEKGRRPWLYRPAGSMMKPDNGRMPYPRICAHRGFSVVAPENSMPAFGAAVALGADEIEFDIWSTKDGELVSMHDMQLDRVSTGTGSILDRTYDELKDVDFGVRFNPAFAGLRIVKFEDILKTFARTTIMNIHVKIWDERLYNPDRPIDPQYERIAALIRQYDVQDHCYIMTASDIASAEFHKVAPDICRCVGWDGNTDVLSMPKRAAALGAEKIQLFKPYFDESSVRLAHEYGLLCNVFWSDEPEEACRFIDMGIDTILSNNYLAVANAVHKHLADKEGDRI